jgi:hypothetical protein
VSSSPNNIGLEQLRLATALVHRVPGAELRLRQSSGTVISVSHHPSADLDPCQFRRVLVASSFNGGTDLCTFVTVESLAGSLLVRAGAAHTTEPDGWWLATLLPPEQTIAVLEQVGGEVGDEGLDARLCVDRQLAVTGAHLTTAEPAGHSSLEQFAATAASRCVVEELIHFARPAWTATRHHLGPPRSPGPNHRPADDQP